MVHAQNFPYKNQIWAYPDCNAQSNIRVWSEEGSGTLALHVLTEKGIMTNKVVNLRNDAGKVVFNYEKAGASETYLFSGNTAQVTDRIVDGKVLIKDGIVQATNAPSPKNQRCDANSIAGKSMAAKIPALRETRNASLRADGENCPFNATQDFLITTCLVTAGAQMYSVAFSKESATSQRLNAKLTAARDAAVDWMKKWGDLVSNADNPTAVTAKFWSQAMAESERVKVLVKSFVDDWNNQPLAYRAQFNLTKSSKFSVELNPDNSQKHPNRIFVWIDGESNKVLRVFDDRSEFVTKHTHDLYNK